MFVASGPRVVGLLAVADPVKPDAADALAELRQLGFRTLLLTGDNERTRAAGEWAHRRHGR